MREIKETANFSLRIKPIYGEMVVVGYTDSSLYGTTCDRTDPEEQSLSNGSFTLLEAGVDLEGYDKHKLRSQAGSLITTMGQASMDSTEDAKFNVMDFRTRASHRVIVSTFGAETSAAYETHGLIHYTRAMFAEIAYGHLQEHLPKYGERHMKTYLMTDCKSLYDHLKCDGKVPEDKHSAIWTAALRSYAAAGPGQHGKTVTRWVTTKWQLADGLTKLGLDKLMRQVIGNGLTKLHELKNPSKSLPGSKEQ